VAYLPTLEERMDDVRAVLNAVGSRRAVLLGVSHVSPSLHVDGTPKAANGHEHHASAGMTGMVLGVSVLPRPGTLSVRPKSASVMPRKMTLVLRSDPHRFGDAPAFGFQLADRHGGASTSVPVSVPGPLLVLKRGEPVEITLVNELPEATAIHWHGMELDSYYDGVHGFGGMGPRVTPLVEPGDAFVVRFTPPRAGTFMYHTHFHDHRQLTSGLYGGMLVVEPDDMFDEATDHVFVLGRDGPQAEAPVAINGMRACGRVARGHTPPHTPHQHHPRRHAVGLDAVGRGRGDMAAAYEGRRSSPGRAVEGATGTADHRRRRDLRFRVRNAAGTSNRMARGPQPGGRWQAQGRVIVK
jgi:FtsP/CotA-like multicopper oxidase with cupredoxin domain